MESDKITAATPSAFSAKGVCDEQVNAAKRMSGGIIALIIISIIFLTALVGFLAAFIQRRLDINALRRTESSGGRQPIQQLARASPGNVGANSSGMGMTPERLAQNELLQMQADAAMHQRQPTAEMMAGRDPMLSNNAAQQGVVPLDVGASGGYNLAAQSQAPVSPGILTPSQLYPQRHANANRALATSMNENAMSAAAGSCVFKPSGAALARAVQSAVNVGGDATSTTAENQVRAISGVVQSALAQDPALRRLIAQASGSIDSDPIVTEAANDGNMVDLNMTPAGSSHVLPLDAHGSTTAQIHAMDIAHEPAGPIRGVTSAAVERDNYAMNLANFAPQSSTMSQQMVNQKMINDRVLRVMACKNPQYAAQILEGVGASQPVTFAGVKTSMSMRPLMYPQISRPPKNDGEFIDAALRPPLVLPIITTGEGPGSTNFSVSQAKISQNCTQASLQ